MDTNTTTPKITEGHPVHTYFLEADLINELLGELNAIDVKQEFQKFYNVFNHLATVEKRFERKENQLFPYLEKKGWTGPSQGMWSFHDTIREIFRIIRKNLDDKDFTSVHHNTGMLTQNLERLLAVEESRLFPNAMELLSDEEWQTMRKGEDEIGWMLPNPPKNYPAEPVYIHPSQDFTQRTEVVFSENASHFDEGMMTIEQVNLLFKTLPIDITYVDENDKVIFYNRGEERVFPRSPGVIGREVRFCHPPKSVDTVLQILEAFRSGKQNEASFWINYKERLIYIRYFAVRDANKKYRGVIEMSQDITEIKQIDGQKRLLEWK